MLLCLNVSTISGGPSSASSIWSTYASKGYFHTLRLRCFYLVKWKGMESKVYPYIWEVLWKRAKEEHCLSDAVSLLIFSPTLLPPTEEGIQTEEESGYNPALQ